MPVFHKESMPLSELVIEIGNKKYVHKPFAEMAMLIILLMCIGMTIAFSHERFMNERLMKVIHSCVNEKGFVYQADRDIGMLCFRDQRAIEEK